MDGDEGEIADTAQHDTRRDNPTAFFKLKTTLVQIYNISEGLPMSGW